MRHSLIFSQSFLLYFVCPVHEQTFAPYRICVIFFTRQTETIEKYISINAALLGFVAFDDLCKRQSLQLWSLKFHVYRIVITLHLYEPAHTVSPGYIATLNPVKARRFRHSISLCAYLRPPVTSKHLNDCESSFHRF